MFYVIFPVIPMYTNVSEILPVSNHYNNNIKTCSLRDNTPIKWHSEKKNPHKDRKEKNKGTKGKETAR